MRYGIPTFLLFTASNCLAFRLTAEADRAFNIYAAKIEARLATQHARPETYLTAAGDFSQVDSLKKQPVPEDLRVEAVNGGTRPIGGALLHHWRGTTYVPHAKPEDMVTLLRDFNHLSKHYAPEIVSSRAITDNGQIATLTVRFKEQKLLTVVLDAEYEVETKIAGIDRGYSISRSTHIWQVDRPGTVQESRRPPGEDDGFLWRLNSYWSFARSGEGLQIECEAVSLTRDVPPGLGWLISPIIAGFPREELEFTLRATKKALTAGLDTGKNHEFTK